MSTEEINVDDSADESVQSSGGVGGVGGVPAGLLSALMVHEEKKEAEAAKMTQVEQSQAGPADAPGLFMCLPVGWIPCFESPAARLR